MWTANNSAMIASKPRFLDQQHLRAFLIDAIRLCSWLLILAPIFLPPERMIQKGQLRTTGEMCPARQFYSLAG
jgi:hypothetical protein